MYPLTLLNSYIYSRVFGKYIPWDFLKRFYLFIFKEGKGGRKRGTETSMCGCLSRAPLRGPDPQPRHVPWLGIELVAFWFSGRHSVHWATWARDFLHRPSWHLHKVRVGFFFSFPNCMPFFFPFLTLLCWLVLPVLCWIRVIRADMPDLFPILGRKTPVFHFKYDTS